MNEYVAVTRRFLKITINRAFYRCSRQHLLKSNDKLSFSSAQPTIWRIKDTHLLSNKFTVLSWHNTLKSSFFHIQVAKRQKSFPFRTYIPRPKQYFNFLFASNSDVENELYGTPYLSTSEDFNSPDSPSRNCLNVFVIFLACLGALHILICNAKRFFIKWTCISMLHLQWLGFLKKNYNC